MCTLPLVVVDVSDTPLVPGVAAVPDVYVSGTRVDGVVVVVAEKKITMCTSLNWIVFSAYKTF